MFCIYGYISVMSNNFTDQHGPKPPLPGEVARRNRDGEVAANLRRPLSQPAADSIPTPFVPSGHFPLIGGIGPWKGSLGFASLEAFPYEGKVAWRSRDG